MPDKSQANFLTIWTSHFQLLLSYAGPASNVRVEHAAQDSFTKGGALAEVMTIYERINSVNTSVTEMRSGGDNEQESRSSAVEVQYI